MILLWGLPEDAPVEAVCRALQQRGAPVMLVDQYKVLDSSLVLHVVPEVGGVLRVGSQEIRLEAVTAAYVRPYDSTALLQGRAAQPGSSAYRLAKAFDACLRAWLDVTPGWVINPMRAMAGNNSKPFQAAQIEATGFRIPDTLVTTDPEAAQEFWDRHGRVVYKSLSGVRSIVSQLTLAHRARLSEVAWCPTQFQQYVPGTDVRVHVVGESLFACEIVSDADDYRYAGRQGLAVDMRACELPPECASKCLVLSRALGLPLAGIDLRRTPDGRWYCFEVNPSPGFTYFQIHTGQPIDHAVADLLLRAPASLPQWNDCPRPPGVLNPSPAPRRSASRSRLVF